MRFSYQATDASGTQLYQGTLEAGSPREARLRLREMGLYPLRLRREPFRRFVRRPALGALALYTSQFATLVAAGVPLTQALVTLAQESPSPALRQATREVRERIEAGESLADAMAHHPEVFPPLMRHLIAAGEAGGALEVTLARLAEYLERAEELNQKIRTALMYPGFVLAVVGVALAVLLLVVIPVFARLYSSAGAALPWPTQALLAASAFAQTYGWLIGLGLLLAGYALRAYYRTPAGAYRLDRLALRLPVLGPILHKAGLGRFGRTFATLYASGLPITQALEATRDLAGNAFIAHAVDEVLQSVVRGESFSAALARHPEVFLPVFTRMSAVGEASGGLDAMLDQAARHLEREVDYAVKRLSASIEPILTVLLGVGILLVALALYLPLFDLSSLITQR
ncbi:type II secretion system F family protein [Marinithermus hydrothermalis]|uniref:Type II secretion system F domain protein n=1 Tax=Marinithermus hydrothermalis (strain DSM 14884 / JCM 11576 / T1) TaxID=869210 RepID=F2NLT0_MARHT|nr:type II secretion system F family protein [Marinithermus hydrothermalis]AEB10910.1 Type II secretion system F domain protein [Marinithermus hydrothermalis DSM 14884]